MKNKLNPIEDFCRFVKREKKEKVHKLKKKYKKIKNNVNIPPVLSNYKNPKSELVALEQRNIQTNVENINYKKFINFNKFLDKIEDICKKKYEQIE